MNDGAGSPGYHLADPLPVPAYGIFQAFDIPSKVHFREKIAKPTAFDQSGRKA
ncbi:MAG: hypothetical protein LBP22_03645 [Deltaproteobacteria bacterium]|jgi:hypothetical protein|nr:hypothetical protein [Deltaproteobacteria bacterium]